MGNPEGDFSCALPKHPCLDLCSGFPGQLLSHSLPEVSVGTMKIGPQLPSDGRGHTKYGWVAHVKMTKGIILG